MVFVLMDSPEDPLFRANRNKWIIGFSALCVGIGIFTYTQRLMFGLGGENLTLTIRKKLFEGIMFKHVGWFDHKDRAPGILTNTISEDI